MYSICGSWLAVLAFTPQLWHYVKNVFDHGTTSFVNPFSVVNDHQA